MNSNLLLTRVKRKVNNEYVYYSTTVHYSMLAYSFSSQENAADLRHCKNNNNNNKLFQYCDCFTYLDIIRGSTLPF